MSSHVTYGKELILEVRCSKCGRILGYYKGEDFWIVGLWKPSDVKIVCLWKPSDVRIVCSQCRGKVKADGEG